MTLGECVSDGSNSVKVELAVSGAQLSASLFVDATCDTPATGYGSQLIKSGECSSLNSDGVFVTLIDMDNAAPEVIFSLACSPDCSSCGFSGRAELDTCIALSTPQFFGMVTRVSAAGALILSILPFALSLVLLL